MSKPSDRSLDIIHHAAFDNSGLGMNNMVFPEGLRIIGNSAFKEDNCNDNNCFTGSITFPSTLTTFGVEPFFRQLNVDDIYLNSFPTVNGGGCFQRYWLDT